MSPLQVWLIIDRTGNNKTKMKQKSWAAAYRGDDANRALDDLQASSLGSKDCMFPLMSPHQFTAKARITERLPMVRWLR